MKLYTHMAFTFGSQSIETVIDLSKVVAIRKAGGERSQHLVFFTGLKAPVEIYDMPATEAKTAEDYKTGREANYNALVTAWKAFTVRGG
jgi:hypothetical protein